MRISNSLFDLSVSPTSIIYIGTSLFVTEETPFEKFEKLIITESKSFH